MPGENERYTASVEAHLQAPRGNGSIRTREDPFGPVAAVVIVSDIRLFRDALEGSLRQQSVSVVATCKTNTVLDMVRARSPDAIVLDGTGPEALAVARSCKAAFPELAIVAVLSIRSEKEFLTWMEAGVRGYVDQNSTTDDLVVSLRQALNGEIHCSPRLTAVLASQLARLTAERRQSSEFDGLTPRERRVLALVADGLSNKRIALTLGISDATTKNHVHNILEKLGLESRAQAAVQYVRLRDVRP